MQKIIDILAQCCIADFRYRKHSVKELTAKKENREEIYFWLNT